MKTQGKSFNPKNGLKKQTAEKAKHGGHQKPACTKFQFSTAFWTANLRTPWCRQKLSTIKTRP